MKNKLFINSLRSIKKMLPRFLSLLIISFLGAFAFLGLESSSTSMINSLDRYLDEGDTYDLKIISTLGLTDADVNALQKINGVKNVEGSYSEDVLIELENEEYVLNISSLTTELNKLELLEGRLPINDNEIVVENNLLKTNKMKIGDSLSFKSKNLKNNELVIVGTIDSTLYFNADSFKQYRGVTTLGIGEINYYSFVMPSLFDINYYSSIYLTVENAKEETTSTNQYLNIINNVVENINEIKNEREESRLKTLTLELNITTSIMNNFLVNQNNKLETLKNEYNEILNQVDFDEDELDIKIEEITNEIKHLNEILLETLPDDPNYNIYQNELNNLNATLSLYENLKNLKNKIIEEEERLIEYEKVYSNTITEIKELLKRSNSKWFIMDRTSYLTYAEYIDDSNSVTNLSKIFPSIFLTVSILISIVSMNRMVEDDRQEIGTLKSLGFSNKHIMFKYLFFAALATAIGGIIGSILGAFVLPKIIFNIYAILFVIPKFYLLINYNSFVIGFVLLFTVILGTTYFTIKKVIVEKPSELIRPKAPKNGKRVFLEKIKFIWNKLNFSNKVTIRNLFRYKKRVISTILGVAGCTALLMCGFGLKDSIADISSRQYGGVYKFDALVYVNNYQEEDNYIFENEKIIDCTKIQNINATVNGINAKIYVIEDSNDIDGFVSLNDYKTLEKRKIENDKIVITQKLAKLENIQVGDYIEILDNNNMIYNYQVSSIVENYAEHFIFMDKETYEKTEQIFTPNIISINTKKLNEEKISELKKELLSNEKVLNVSFTSEMIDKVNDMLGLLDKIILVIIILASLLSFVVLYNLSNINIQERKREIATLKVLGFHNKEVNNYITKENTILTIIGILVGFIVGYFLTLYIINAVEIEKAVFIKKVNLSTYIYSAILALLFTIIVNLIMNHLLKKINMIESLKSVE